MSTLFTDIFNEFLQTEVSSVDLATKYTQPQLSNYLSILLKRSREEFFNFAFINPPSTIPKMQDCIELWIKEYDFTYTGITFTTTLSPIPVLGSLYYVTVDGVVVLNSNITYNSSTGDITINNMTNVAHSIVIIFWLDGIFNQSLSLVESGIIVSLMGMAWLRDKIKTQLLINQAIYGKDSGFYSQANHMKSLNDTYNDIKKDVYQRMYVYSYQSNSNPQLLGGKG